MGVWSWLRGRGWGSGARAQASIPRDVAEQMGLQLFTIGGGRPPKRGSEEILRAYGEMPWLHACTKRVAEALAAVEWTAFRLTRDNDKSRGPARSLPGMRASGPDRQRASQEHLQAGLLERVNHHALLDLLDRPNPVMTGRSLWELTSKHHSLMGESFWGVDRAGAPAGLWPIVPTWVRSTPTVENPFFLLASGSKPRAVADMIWIRQHDPLDPYLGRGIGTARALGDVLETDSYMAQMAKARFFNRSTPDVVVAFPSSGGGGPIGQEAIEDIQRGWDEKNRGIHRAGSTHFFGRDVKVMPLGNTMVESQYVDGRKLLRDFTVQTFGVPPEILGVLENSNRSTIDAAEVLFARFSTVPMLERIRSELQAWLVPEFGDDLVLDYVSPVPADRDYQKAVMVALPAAFKLDEIRARAGEEPLKGDAGLELYAAPGAVPTPGDAPKLPGGAKPGEKPAAPGADAVVVDPAAATVQDTAMNGAQSEALQAVVLNVATGVMSKPTAKAFIQITSPAIAEAKIDALLNGIVVKEPAEPPVAKPAAVPKEKPDAVPDA